MLPANIIYPEFVPDQLLTSDDLNHLFGYLDEQERLTRTNLIGIGIVCGLEVVTSSGGNSVKITQGCGITSQGYLITVPEITYTEFENFNAVQPVYYDKFVNTVANPKTQKFNLWELKQAGETTGTINLSSSFLSDKVVLLFIELLEEENKNCDPNSCDDRGKDITVTIRALLVLKNDINTLNATADCALSPTFSGFTEIRMPRWNVPNTNPVTSDAILNSFKAVLSPAFINNIQTAFTDVYNKINPLLVDEFNSNPFQNFSSDFNFINNGSISVTQLNHIQYYYDLFSDFLQAYDEFCKKGSEIFCKDCCPDASLFPRHLLLGEAINSGSSIVYRHHFIYSPLFDHNELETEVKFLFRRLVYIYRNRVIPAPLATINNGINITPSTLGLRSFSEKSIPYYYHANTSPDILFQTWNYQKTIQGKANKNLSYNSASYNTADDFIINPLKYDLEPYNFFRIEGHVGQSFREVLTNIQNQKKANRLPFDVIALATGDPDLSNITDAIKQCNIRDLETSYEIVRREWEAIIGQTIEYLDNNMPGARRLLEEFMVGSDILGDYMIALHSGKKYMDDDLDLLAIIHDYTNFIILYESIEKQSTDLRNDLTSVLDNDELSTEDRTLGEDLIDHFDEVALSCKKGTFRAIYQEFNNRTGEIYSNIFFSNYAEKNPGLQHKAGVTAGGTFIIVYNKILSPKPVTITGNVFNQAGAPQLAVVIVKGTTLSTFTSVNGFFSITVPALPVVLQAQTFGFNIFNFTGFTTGEILVDASTVFPFDFIVVPGSVVNLPGNNNGSNNIADEIVIADFYLPYVCCSDCTPVSLTIQEPDIAPTAVASASPATLTLPDNEVTLDGTASTDPEGPIKTYTWSLAAGSPACTIVNKTAATTKVTGMSAAGIYGFNLIVTDEEDRPSVPASTTVIVNPKPCTFPCGGEAEKCNYILWIQKPDPDHSIKLETNSAIITLTDENAPALDIDVTAIFNDTLDSTDINAANYDDVFNKLFDKLNSQVPAQFLADGQPMFEYDSAKQLFTIDRFICQFVTISIDISLTNLDFNLSVIIDDKGVTIKNVEDVITVSKFGCIKTNKCLGTTEDGCTENLAIEDIKGQQEEFGGQTFAFSATPDFDNYYWYFADGRPMWSDQKSPSGIFLSNSQNPLIRVIGINANGCFAILEKNVDISFIVG